MRAFKERYARTVTLHLFLLLLAYFVRVIELFEKLIRVLDAIDAEVEIVDVLIAGPQPRRFVGRIRFVCRQRKVWLGAGDGWRFGRGSRYGRGRRAISDDVESED